MPAPTAAASTGRVSAVGIEREALKRMVADHDIRIMVATDAACEGLNLQTLGTLINVDLPWNPTRLEQRIGRIKRFGQTRSVVDMLNLVHQGTVDEKVYERLSERMRKALSPRHEALRAECSVLGAQCLGLRRAKGEGRRAKGEGRRALRAKGEGRRAKGEGLRVGATGAIISSAGRT
jgi:superfamily II DNA/RNA helicase